MQSALAAVLVALISWQSCHAPADADLQRRLQAPTHENQGLQEDETFLLQLQPALKTVARQKSEAVSNVAAKARCTWTSASRGSILGVWLTDHGHGTLTHCKKLCERDSGCKSIMYSAAKRRCKHASCHVGDGQCGANETDPFSEYFDCLTDGLQQASCPSDFPVCLSTGMCGIDSCRAGCGAWVRNENYILGYDRLGTKCTIDHTVAPKSSRVYPAEPQAEAACEGLQLKDFENQTFSFKQSRTFYRDDWGLDAVEEVSTYDITVGRGIFQQGQDSEDFRRPISRRTFVGQHQYYQGWQEIFANGDRHGCDDDIARSAIVSYILGRRFKLLKAYESSPCIYQYEVELPVSKCIDAKLRKPEMAETCFDRVPPSGERWHDVDNRTYDCAWYAVGDRCTKFGAEASFQGYTAMDACCACGGGQAGHLLAQRRAYWRTHQNVLLPPKPTLNREITPTLTNNITFTVDGDMNIGIPQTLQAADNTNLEWISKLLGRPIGVKDRFRMSLSARSNLPERPCARPLVVVPPDPCDGLTPADFVGKNLTVTQVSTLHQDELFTYQIIVGQSIVQTTEHESYIVGQHHAFHGWNETFTNGDAKGCGNVQRSATISYKFGPKLQLLKAWEPSVCSYDYIIQIPMTECAATQKAKEACTEMSMEDFTGSELHVEQVSTLHRDEVYKYHIKVGHSVNQDTTTSKYLVGQHQNFDQMTEHFNSGDSEGCEGKRRSATIHYTFGSELKLLRASEPSLCAYEYEVQVPWQQCLAKKQLEASCKELGSKDFEGRQLTVTQVSTLHHDEVYTYHISVGGQIIQETSGANYIVGTHKSYGARQEYFENGDKEGCEGKHRSAKVFYKFGPELKLLQATEPALCEYEYVIQVPTEDCFTIQACRGLQLEDFAGEDLTVEQPSTLHENGEMFTYHITVGEQINQTTSGAKYLVGNHRTYDTDALSERFTGGDTEGCNGNERSATVNYKFGSKMKLLKAVEPSLCAYEYDIQIPVQKCLDANAAKERRRPFRESRETPRYGAPVIPMQYGDSWSTIPGRTEPDKW